MADVMTFEVDGEVGIITIDYPPVNALSVYVRQGLSDGMKLALGDDQVKAIVIVCAGRTFFAGADISEFSKPPMKPYLLDVFDEIEASTKLTLVAIHGTALGGGLEISLCCHYRIAVPSAKMGLPEVHLGILPGAGGTQRLPRIIGVPAALDVITSGKPFGAKKAHELGVIDVLASEDDLRGDAVAYARKLIADGAPLLKVRDRNDKVEAYRGNTQVFDDFRKKNARKFRGFRAPENIIQCIEAAVNLPFEDGIKQERSLFRDLFRGTQPGAQQHVFFAERQTAKVPDVPKDTATRAITSVGVIGAGTMGGGIAMNFLSIGTPVAILDRSEEALERGVAVIRRNYDASAKKGRMTADQVEACMALLTPATDYSALSDADLIIEAVFESMDVKKAVFAQLDSIAKEGAILASNTSYLDLDEIAASTKRPEDVIGLHFFSPANIMPLLEIVRGESTSIELISTAMKTAKTIGKTPVLSRVCDGFIANRIMSARKIRSDGLALQGVSPADIDRVIYDYGFAMGPYRMADLVGLDVIGRDSDEITPHKALVAKGRLGQKQNGGYYDYDENRNAALSPIAVEVIADIAKQRGITPITITDEDILAELLYPVVNEGARILEDAIALRASDIDIACIKGYNWPVYSGGPMYWADTVGLQVIVDKLKDMEATYGDAFTPAPLLVKLAKDGAKLARVKT